MKRFVSVLCLLALILSFMFPVFAVDADNNNNFVAEVEAFLMEAVYVFDNTYALPKCDSIFLGAEIPSYLLNDNGEYTPSPSHFYPVISKSEVIGLIECLSNNNGTYTFTYTEGYSDSINELKSQEIAIICDDVALTFISNANTAFLSQDNRAFSFSNPLNAEAALNPARFATRSTPDAFSLDVRVKEQHATWACWAACVACVGRFYTEIDLSSSQVAQQAGIQTYADMSQVKNALYSIYSVQVSNIKYTLSVTNLIRYIYNDGWPILTGYLNSGYVGHMFVLYGYSSGSSYLNLALMDPEQGFISVRVIKEADMSFNLNGKTWSLVEYVY